MVRNYHASPLGKESRNSKSDQIQSSFGKFIKSGTIRASDGRYINYGGAFVIGSQHLPTENGEPGK